MSKYLSIEFEGSYPNLMKFFESKEWTFETKKIASQKIFVKVPEELADEVKFFESSEEGIDTKMTKVTSITEEDYINTAENGFEIINPHQDNKSISESTAQIISSNVISQEDTKHILAANEQGFPQSTVQPIQTSDLKTENKEENKPENKPENKAEIKAEIKAEANVPNMSKPQVSPGRVSRSAEEVSDDIARALADTVLPSKSPLDPEDPFAYLTSRPYLKSFAMASSVLLFIIALLD